MTTSIKRFLNKRPAVSIALFIHNFISTALVWAMKTASMAVVTISLLFENQYLIKTCNSFFPLLFMVSSV